MRPDMRAALIGAVLVLGAPLAAEAAPLADSGPNGAPVIETPVIETGGIAISFHGQPGVREIGHRGSHYRSFRHRGFRGKLQRRHHSGRRHFLHRPKRSPDIFFHPKGFHHKRFRPRRFHNRGRHGSRHRGHHALPYILGGAALFLHALHRY